jgi:hypothetical protein
MLDPLTVNPDRCHQYEVLGDVNAINLHHQEVQPGKIRSHPVLHALGLLVANSHCFAVDPVVIAAMALGMDPSAICLQWAAPETAHGSAMCRMRPIRKSPDFLANYRKATGDAQRDLWVCCFVEFAESA